MFFDARKAKLLKAGEHLLIDGCQGLRLVATESTCTWVYRYKAGDKMKQARLGHWPAVSVQAAAAQWQAMRDARESGSDPKALLRRPAKPVPAVYTTRELVEDYISGHLEQNRTAASSVAATRALRRLLDEDSELSRMAAADMTRARAFSVIEARKDYPTAAAKLKSLMAAAWDYAHDSGKLEAVNWWREVMRGRLKTKGKIVGGEHVGPARRALSLDEVRTLLKWSENMHEHGRDMLILYLWTCTRGNEIAGMTGDHITQERGQWWWTIPASMTKNASNPHAVDLRVPLFGRALEVVQRRMCDGLLFGGYMQHDFSTYIYDLQPYSVKSKARPERLTLPVTHWTPHNLRRTSRTLLASMGCPDEVGEAILGHMPTTIVATYNRATYDKERCYWLEKLSEKLSSLFGADA